MSAYDTLLQEINVVYAVNLDMKEVKWSAVKDKLPTALVDLMEKEWKAEWFKRLRWYRNTATHRMYLPTGASTGGYGETPRDYGYHYVRLFYVDTDANEWRLEDIKVCPDYLKRMIEHIRAVWGKMAEEFD